MASIAKDKLGFIKERNIECCSCTLAGWVLSSRKGCNLSTFGGCSSYWVNSSC